MSFGTCANVCASCPRKYNPVSGAGPMPAHALICGERPGADENRTGVPFCGQSGRELNENYLSLAGLRRDEVYVTNAVHCFADQNKKPTEIEARTCAAHWLRDEIEEVQPEVIILLGSTACGLVEGIDLESGHGIPVVSGLFGYKAWFVPMYHPASGLHDSVMMTPMLSDWEGLRRWLADGTWTWPVDAYPKRDYALIENISQFNAYILQSHPESYRHNLIGGDTETHAREDFSLQFTLQTGTGRMILMKDDHLVREFGNWLNASIGFGNAELVLHHAPADLRLFESVCSGMRLDGHYRDTMAEAYLFGDLRQGLKPLALRLLGRKRPSWEEVVTPPSKDALGEWLMSAFVYAEENWQVVESRVSAKTGKALKPRVVVSKPEKLLRELFGYMTTNPEYKIWDKLRERLAVAYPDDMARLVDVVGPVPQLGIAHVRLNDAVNYACSDADDTLALALLFDSMRTAFINDLNVQAEDYDA